MWLNPNLFHWLTNTVFAKFLDLHGAANLTHRMGRFTNPWETNIVERADGKCLGREVWKVTAQNLCPSQKWNKISCLPAESVSRNATHPHFHHDEPGPASFSSQETDWSSHTLTGRQRIRLELFQDGSARIHTWNPSNPPQVLKQQPI